MRVLPRKTSKKKKSAKTKTNKTSLTLLSEALGDDDH